MCMLLFLHYVQPCRCSSLSLRITPGSMVKKWKAVSKCRLSLEPRSRWSMRYVSTCMQSISIILKWLIKLLFMGYMTYNHECSIFIVGHILCLYSLGYIIVLMYILLWTCVCSLERTLMPSSHWDLIWWLVPIASLSLKWSMMNVMVSFFPAER